MDQKSLKQSGFGLALGGTVGAMIPFEKGDTTTTYGPVLSLIFPKYNAGTASFSSTQVNFMILPTKGFTMFLAGVQFAFG
jgi:hypothetical protein